MKRTFTILCTFAMMIGLFSATGSASQAIPASADLAAEEEIPKEYLEVVPELDPSVRRCRGNRSDTTGASTAFNICWDGTTVQFAGYTNDTLRDGLVAVAITVVELYINGTWERHVGIVPYSGATDSATRVRYPPQHEFTWAYPARGQYIAACRYNFQALLNCGPWR